MITAICFGSIFGVPFFILGLILIRDRDRTWAINLRESRDKGVPPRRTKAWDLSQQLFGALLILFGGLVLWALILFNHRESLVVPYETNYFASMGNTFSVMVKRATQ